MAFITVEVVGFIMEVDSTIITIIMGLVDLIVVQDGDQAGVQVWGLDGEVSSTCLSFFEVMLV